MRYLILIGLATSLLTSSISKAEDLDREKAKLLQIAHAEVVRIQNSRTVYTREFGQRLYCIDQCACTSLHLQQTLKENFPNVQTRIVLLKPTDGFSVIMNSTEKYDFHEAVEVLLDDHPYILDPILERFKPLSLLEENEWLSHFSNFSLSYLN